MKLPLFGKDKGAEDQEKIDAAIMSDYEDQEAVLKPASEAPSGPGGADASGKGMPEAVRKLSMDVEKLKVQTEAMLQLRSLQEERFQRMNEEIGDLRRRLIDKEKEISQLRIEAAKATELVSAVQPQKLMKELQKEGAKVEMIRAKQDANRAIIDSVVEEMKNVKGTISTFKGMEMLIKLSEEVKQELSNIKKVEASVEKHANKVESIFGSIQSRFNEFIRLSDKVGVIDSSFKKASKEFDQIRVQMGEYSKKDELMELKKGVDEKTKDVLARVEGIEKLGREFQEEAHKAKKSGEKSFYDFETRIDNRMSEAEAYTKDLSNRLEMLVMVQQDNLRAMQRQYRELEEVFRKGSEQPNIDEATRTLLRRVHEQLRENQAELSRNVGLIDSLGK
jgi:chromosome segregation ATPase